MDVSGGTHIKQLTVISGKGGTGKTTLVAAFASLAKNAVLADCDVDAADLHLILKPEILERQDFTGLRQAEIDGQKCTGCGKCREHCHFGAIGEDFLVIQDRCEGCGVCRLVCPAGAVRLEERKAGEAYLSRMRFGPMSHAELEPGGEASGKLVSLVIANARKLAEKEGRGLIIIDGPPGTGCPVIASIGGSDLALVITEPSLSGIHDMERVLAVCEHFRVPAAVCINKHDINDTNTCAIEIWCKSKGLDVVGKIPYAEVTTRAMIAGKTVIEFDEGGIGRDVAALWSKVLGHLGS